MYDQHPYLKRIMGYKIEKLFKNFACLVITGARQVGKSTLLKHLFPDIPMIVFDPVQDIHNARNDPELFLNNNPPPIILDEIQYLPELIPAIKRRIDKKKIAGQYILTGSQQWGILKSIAESLTGRAILTHLEGFSLQEIAKASQKENWLEKWLSDPESFFSKKHSRLDLRYSVNEQLYRGFLPETQFIDLEFISDFHYSYQSTYIEKDIRTMAEVSELQIFSRFVKIVAALTAQEINYSEIGREIGITPQTAKRWLSLLMQTFQWFEVPAFSNNAIKKISLKSKGYFSDSGQVCFSQRISSKDAISGHPLWGALFETAVVCEIKKQSLFMSMPPQMYHYRSYSQVECDLILERDGKYYPIEIKAKTYPTKKDAKGIEAFIKAHPKLNIQKGLIIAPSEEIYALTDDVTVIPWDILF